MSQVSTESRDSRSLPAKHPEFFRNSEAELDAARSSCHRHIARKFACWKTFHARPATTLRPSAMLRMRPTKMTPGHRCQLNASPHSNRLSASRSIATPLLVMGFVDDVISPHPDWDAKSSSPCPTAAICRFPTTATSGSWNGRKPSTPQPSSPSATRRHECTRSTACAQSWLRGGQLARSAPTAASTYSPTPYQQVTGMLVNNAEPCCPRTGSRHVDVVMNCSSPRHQPDRIPIPGYPRLHLQGIRIEPPPGRHDLSHPTGNRSRSPLWREQWRHPDRQASHWLSRSELAVPHRPDYPDHGPENGQTKSIFFQAQAPASTLIPPQ